jgi:aminopeptidase N
LRDSDSFEAVKRRTEYGIPTRGRRAAIHALVELGHEREVRRHLQELLVDADPHLRIDVVAAIESLGDGRARAALRRRLDRELDGRVKRRIREALRNLTDAARSERRRVNDDLETLRRELSELKLRLAQVEEKRSAQATKGKKSAGGRKTAHSTEPSTSAGRARRRPKKASKKGRTDRSGTPGSKRGGSMQKSAHAQGRTSHRSARRKGTQ